MLQSNYFRYKQSDTNEIKKNNTAGTCGNVNCMDFKVKSEIEIFWL